MRQRIAGLAGTVGLLLVGLLGTAAVALVLFPVSQPIQPVVYRAVYTALGPSDATTAATLVHAVVVCAVAIAVPVLLAHRYTGGTTDLRTIAAGVGIVFGLLVVAVAFLLTGAIPARLAFVGLFLVFAAVPVVLRYRFGVRSGGVTALAGAMPTFFLLLLLVGFGLGWGWGYVVHAEAVPESAADGAAVVDFDEAPELRDDLFAASNCDGNGDSRECYLELRGYEHERPAVRFLASHGVRCPFQGSSSQESGSFVTEYRGSYFRVSCGPHGD